MSSNKLRRHWALEGRTVFLNHGSFGACPKPVLEAQQALRYRLEREPVRFFLKELAPLVAAARARVAEFVGADPDDLVFVPNATSGVNAVLRSLRFAEGDEILVSDQAYNACRNTVDFVAARWGARVVVAQIPFPIRAPGDATTALVNAVSARTKLALVDHIASPTGLIMPVADIARALAERGVEMLVDGAHAPGMVPLRLRELGVAYYTANFHKWVCAPKGAGMLYVRGDRQADIHPTVISHGFNSRSRRSRFLEEFDWVGTDDPTAILTVPDALGFMASLLPGGWPDVYARNHELAVSGRRILCEKLGVEPPAPESMVGSLAAVPLVAGRDDRAFTLLDVDPLQAALYERHHIQVPIIYWPAPPQRWVRISAQLYNHEDEYRQLADALAELQLTV